MNANIPTRRAEFGPFQFLKTNSRLVMALLAVGLLALRADAQTNLSTADQTFILSAAQGGMTEVKLGELAAQKGTREDVKSFGKMMVKDHTAINDDLTALAAQKAVMIPAALDAEHQATVDKLTALSDADFDGAYIADMIKGHKSTAKAFKAEAAATTDADIKAFLDKSLPIVQAHLKHLKAMK